MELLGRPSIAGDLPDEIQGVAELSRSLEGEVPRNIKWTKACDKRLNRLISYIHPTS